MSHEAPRDRHTRVALVLVDRHNEGFLEGVCHAIDVLRLLGDDAAADRAEAVLFKPIEATK